MDCPKTKNEKLEGNRDGEQERGGYFMKKDGYPSRLSGAKRKNVQHLIKFMEYCLRDNAEAQLVINRHEDMRRTKTCASHRTGTQ